MDAGRTAPTSRFESAPPRNFILPALLLLVLERPGYGYELVPRAQSLGLRPCRPARRLPGPLPAGTGRPGRPVVPEPDGGPGPTGLPDHPRWASGCCGTGWGWSRRSTTTWARCSAAIWPPGPPTRCWPRWRGAGPRPSAPGGRRCRPPRSTRRWLEAVPEADRRPDRARLPAADRRWRSTSRCRAASVPAHPRPVGRPDRGAFHGRSTELRRHGCHRDGGRHGHRRPGPAGRAGVGRARSRPDWSPLRQQHVRRRAVASHRGPPVPDGTRRVARVRPRRRRLPLPPEGQAHVPPGDPTRRGHHPRGAVCRRAG